MPEPQPLILNYLNLTERSTIFAHVFYEDSDKKVSYIASIATKYGEMKHAIQNIMKAHNISPECIKVLSNNPRSSAIKPFVNYFEKRDNLKEFSKFSNIILTVDCKRKFCYKVHLFYFSCSGTSFQKTGITAVNGLETTSAADKGMHQFDKIEIIS